MAVDNTDIYRIVDANANRAREGLRVVEEYLRLAKDSADFSARLKDLRHRVTGAILSMHADEKLIAARQSDTDVGATAPGGPEKERRDLNHKVAANHRRWEEALRVDPNDERVHGYLTRARKQIERTRQILGSSR